MDVRAFRHRGRRLGRAAAAKRSDWAALRIRWRLLVIVILLSRRHPNRPLALARARTAKTPGSAAVGLGHSWNLPRPLLRDSAAAPKTRKLASPQRLVRIIPIIRGKTARTAVLVEVLLVGVAAAL